MCTLKAVHGQYRMKTLQFHATYQSEFTIRRFAFPLHLPHPTWSHYRSRFYLSFCVTQTGRAEWESYSYHILLRQKYR